MFEIFKKKEDKGLEERVYKANNMKRNLEIASTSDRKHDSWKYGLESKTAILYGGRDEDGMFSFKIDKYFDLNKIVNKRSKIKNKIDKETYTQSRGTEFVIIPHNKLKHGFLSSNYAIRADTYRKIKKDILDGNYNSKDLEKAGGFVIGDDVNSNEDIVKLKKGAKKKAIDDLTLEDFEFIHDGYANLAIKENRANPSNYLEAAKLLVKHISNVKKDGSIFGFGGFYAGEMGFYVNEKEKKHKAKLFTLGNQNSGFAAHGTNTYTPEFVRKVA